MRRVFVAAGAAMLLAGCGSDNHQDLRQWMADQGKGVRGNVEPLPQIKPYEPFAYNAFDLPDPFKPRKVDTLRPVSKLQPDANRRKEPLEAFPLESLHLVGSLQRGRDLQALVRTTEKDVYRVRVGNYLGQNYGVVIAINDNEVKLRELVQDSGGDWTERTSTLLLEEPEQKDQKK